MALANYVLHAPVEADQIARLRVGQITSCPGDDSSMTSTEGDESWVSDAPSSNPPTDTDCEVGEESKEPMGVRKEQTGG